MADISHRIAGITPGSPADGCGLGAGDILLQLNGVAPKDIFDYHYYADDEIVDVLAQKPDGTQITCHIEKELGQDPGILFENGLMDDYKSCHNRCIFCFIDQMPPGMRETLYFKDDDTRLSFLQGNYVTLTNIGREDLERIIAYRLAPINISVHTTNPQLRCRMLNNRFAGDILEKISMLAEADIAMNAQIVLCKGVNDGEELERTISELLEFYPSMQSLSVVPVGLTKYRQGLYPLEAFARQDAAGVLSIIERWQEVCKKRYGLRFVHASDEWYLLAGRPLPEEECYDGYPQLENGVGMLRLLWEEFHEALERAHCHPFRKHKSISVATGLLAAPFITRLCRDFTDKFPKTRITVYPVRNDFFGEKITVSGLVTGRDLMEQLKEKDLGDRLLLPCNMLRADEEVFLDDVTLEQVKTTLQVPVDIVKSSGQDFVDRLLHA